MKELSNELNHAINTLKESAKDKEDFRDNYTECVECANQLDSIPKELTQLADEFENAEESPAKKKGANVKNQIMSKLRSQRDEINRLRNKVNEWKRDGPPPSTDQEDEQVDDKHQEQMIKVKNLDKVDSHLKNRREQLNDIKQTSKEVQQMTEMMKHQVHEQGELLNQFEDNVLEIKSNTEKAENEIKTANQLDKGNNSKLRCLIIFGAFVGIAIVILIVLAAKGKFSSG